MYFPHKTIFLVSVQLSQDLLNKNDVDFSMHFVSNAFLISYYKNLNAKKFRWMDGKCLSAKQLAYTLCKLCKKMKFACAINYYI